jgi:hypothetical protein
MWPVVVAAMNGVKRVISPSIGLVVEPREPSLKSLIAPRRVSRSVETRRELHKRPSVQSRDIRLPRKRY